MVKSGKTNEGGVQASPAKTIPLYYGRHYFFAIERSRDGIVNDFCLSVGHPLHFPLVDQHAFDVGKSPEKGEHTNRCVHNGVMSL